MSSYEEEFLPVVSPAEENVVIGLLTYKEVLNAYKLQLKEDLEASTNLSLKRQRMKIVLRGRQLMEPKKVKI
ncbi:hypothetical protein [Desertivirga xinjiangensis]|uniref:hypothetical protein n=1 Tax=Desertivirga xinjiangensis TaxID=539206 RepID=UPI00210E2C9C|nr:hypothetical protein [Pedobacter xinjiangensis]